MSHIASSQLISLLWQYTKDETERRELLSSAPRCAETLGLFYEYMSQKLPKNILDFGTGDGWMAILVKTLFPWHNIVAADVHISDRVKERLATFGIEVLEGCQFKGGNRLPLRDASFDACLFFEVFEHVIEEPRWVLHELFRILREGGSLFLTTPNLAHIYNRFILLRGRQPQLFLTGLRQGSESPRGHFREWTMEELLDLLRESGFCVIDKRYLYAVGSSGLMNERPLLRLLYYPYKVLLAILPTLRSQLGFAVVRGRQPGGDIGEVKHSY